MKMTTLLNSSAAAYAADTDKLDALATNGYLNPEGGGGRGFKRQWRLSEVFRARLMARLMDLGLSPSAASSVLSEPNPILLDVALADQGQPVDLGGLLEELRAKLGPQGHDLSDGLPISATAFVSADGKGGLAIRHNTIYVTGPSDPFTRMNEIDEVNNRSFSDLLPQRIYRATGRLDKFRSFETTMTDRLAAEIALHLYQEAAVCVERALRVLGEV